MVEKWSFWYSFLKPPFRFAYWLFHRKIEVVGKENIPENSPVLYAPNHPNALNDDLSIVYSAPHQVVWLGRADIFRSSLARPVLKFVKVIPVYRIRDGKESLGQNEQTFTTAIRILMNNDAIGLYPEADNSGYRHMVAHKKAVSRIVFLAAEKSGFTLDTQIVPVGLYFDKNHKYGRRLLIVYGKPIEAKKYYTEYQANPHNATLALRDDLYHAILSLTINYRTNVNIEGFEAVRMISSKQLLDKSGLPHSMYNQLKTDQQLIEKLEHLETTNPGKISSLTRKALDFTKKLQSLGIRSWLVDQEQEKSRKMLLHFLFLIVSAPLFIFGFLFSFIPFFALDTLVRKKVRQEIFKSTFGFGLGIFVFPLVYIIEMLLVSPLLPGWYFMLLFLISLPLTGKFAFIWYILLRKTLGRWRWLRIKHFKPELYREIHREKEEIINSVD